MKILHLTLKKQWFKMIASGEKKEEYREIKPYWATRLIKHWENVMLGSAEPFVQFKNGYNRDSPKIVVRLVGLAMREGKEEWGAEKGVKYFVLQLGSIVDAEDKSGL